MNFKLVIENQSVLSITLDKKLIMIPIKSISRIDIEKKRDNFNQFMTEIKIYQGSKIITTLLAESNNETHKGYIDQYLAILALI